MIMEQTEPNPNHNKAPFSPSLLEKESNTTKKRRSFSTEASSGVTGGSALQFFRWARLRSGYKHRPKAYDMMVDNLGRMKQMDQMRAIRGNESKSSSCTQHCGLEKNSESMNLLLDTLCKEGYVEQASAIFLELKSHIWPNAHPFNIFIHGCYSTIILFYCRQYNFYKVYELLDEIEARGCPPNAVTYTTITVFLAKAQNFEEALQLAQRMKSTECKPDMTSTHNSMIAMLCHDGQVSKALALLKEMETLAPCKLDGQTFYSLLKACVRIGDMNLLIQLMDEMVKKHQLSLDRSVYALLIHGLCRANKCQWACHLFEEMIGKNI
ncbi:hypothetical protein Peur_005085 [Populus x canadensis]